VESTRSASGRDLTYFYTHEKPMREETKTLMGFFVSSPKQKRRKIMEIKNIEAIVTPATAPVTTGMLEQYLAGVGGNLPVKEKQEFLQVAKAFGLNPFLREIYAVAYRDRQTGNLTANIIVGYEVYLKRAERSGMLAGWRAWTEGSGSSLRGIVEIRRKDWASEFRHEVYFDEYTQNNSMWRTKPRTMIKKVAIAQGFRMAFPCELGGMPYTSDEIEIGSGIATPAPVSSVTPADSGEKPKDSRISEQQLQMLLKKAEAAGLDQAEICQAFNLGALYEAKQSHMKGILTYIRDNGKKPAAPAPTQAPVAEKAPEPAPATDKAVGITDPRELLNALEGRQIEFEVRDNEVIAKPDFKNSAGREFLKSQGFKWEPNQKHWAKFL